MSEHKRIQKELKQPDQFQTRALKVMGWMQKNPKTINIALGSIVVVFTTIIAVQAFRTNQKDARRTELTKIDLEYNAEDKIARDKRSDLQKKIQELLKKETKPEIDKSESNDASQQKEEIVDVKKIADERKLLQEKLEKIESDHSKSKELYIKFFDKHPSQPEGWIAGIKAVQIMLEKKDYSDANDKITAILKHATGSKFYQIQLRVLHVSILEELGEFDAALKEVETLEKTVDEDYKPKLLLTKGRIQILKSQKKEAFATLQGLVDKYGSSVEASTAKTIMALWN
ncbi:MAG: tetratricopeptide repeat protein [Bdellovibrionota bacterium]